MYSESIRCLPDFKKSIEKLKKSYTFLLASHICETPLLTTITTLPIFTIVMVIGL
jgi:hypothetical protein